MGGAGAYPAGFSSHVHGSSIFTEPLISDTLSTYGIQVVQQGAKKSNSQKRFVEVVVKHPEYARLLKLQKLHLSFYGKFPAKNLEHQI